jgi:uncharacterized protein (TIGR03435 family)
MIPAIANHLWQSTLFGVALGALTLALRNNRASVRYAVWMAASLKFLVPFTLLMGIGSQAPAVVARHIGAVPVRTAVALIEVSEPFPLAPAPPTTVWPDVLAAVWACGFAVVVFCWIRQWRMARTNPAGAPGVFGIFRPKLVMPQGIEERLTPEQMRAVITHELCHIRRRDNLLAMVHGVAQALFWFHPLLWWIGARLMEERERACDEEVLRQGADPQEYASGILEICKWYVEAQVACVSGVTGADLKRRIACIMSRREVARLSPPRKALLVAVGVLSLMAPVAVGLLRLAAAQDAAALAFAVASINRSDPKAEDSSYRLLPGGGLRVANLSLKQILLTAYDLREAQLIGAPSWIESERYDILAKPDRPEGPEALRDMPQEQARELERHTRERVRALLATRFGLVARNEKKEMTVFALVQSKSGHRLRASKADDPEPRHLQIRVNPPGAAAPAHMEGKKTNMTMLARALAGPMGGIVVDATGLAGAFDFDLDWTPESGQALSRADSSTEDASDGARPSLSTALEEQLGLRIERRKAPVDVLVVERVERPTEN